MNTEAQVYTITTNGKEKKVRFTGKRGEILELWKQGSNLNQILEKGYNKGTAQVVLNQAKKLGLVPSTVRASTSIKATTASTSTQV